MNDKLKQVVITRIGGKDNAKLYFQDVCNYGASGGFTGFIYYKDTISFWKRHKKLIMEYTEEMANDLGEDLLSMVSNFNVIKGNYTQTEIGQALFGEMNENKYAQIYNVMAWFALEEVARDYCNKKGL